MEWLSANWFWVLIFVLFMFMHMFGHGAHGGHGGHGGHGADDEDEGRSEKRPQGEGPAKDHHHH